MQRLFHIAPGADHAVEVDPADATRLRGQGWVWLGLTGLDVEELVAVKQVFDLDDHALGEVISDTSFPTVEAYGDHTFIIGFGLALDEERLRLVEVDAFVGPDFLITVTREDLPGLDWGVEHITTPGALAGAGPDRFFSRLAEVGALRLQPLIDHLDERIGVLEDSAIDADPAVPVDVQALRRDLVTIRRGTAPARRVYRTVEAGGHPAIGDRARLRFGSVGDHYDRLTDDVDAARGLLGGVLDTYRSAVAERANEVMKVLTVFAAIVLPMSLLAGIYGMNFANMPELGWDWAYFALLGAMASVGLGLWVYFARRGFIGGPKLSSIPRGVGRGLAGIVGVTLRPTLRLLSLIPHPRGSTDDD